MFSVTPLASGSGGNCLLISGRGTHILMDAGISCRRITTALRSLGVDPAALTAVLVTHEHSDHICGLSTLLKQFPIPVYASVGTAAYLTGRAALPADRVISIPAGSQFSVDPFACTSFPTPHDAADSVGYTVELDGRRLALVTDLGHVTSTVRRAVLGCDALVVESNHDVDWLRSGPYPYPLKQRILGDRGHLCNEACAELVAQAVQAGAHTIILAHLSRENNTPVRAYDVTSHRLSALGLNPEHQIHLAVAHPTEPGPVFVLEKEVVPC